ncbi:MAG TPA: MFS transporter [Azospirillaceae bacterium]|nr:MFS transporter [Azospirillaceae bacterium]
MAELHAPSAAAGAQTNSDESAAYRAYVLFILILVYTFNFIDRQIISVLAVPIKAELGLSDGQLGLVSGVAFALFYTAMGIPIARLADRRNRVWIIGISLAVWSGFTALCGYAHSFWQLFLYRLGVGVGEAGGVAPSYSLVTDYFPPHQRAKALGIYSFGIPIGSALGIFFGGYIAQEFSWRAAFIACGVAGLVLMPLFVLTLKEPARGRFDPPTAKVAQPSFGEVLRTLAAKPAFWYLAFGAACSSIMGYGLFFWLPSFFVRSHGLTLVEMAQYFGTIVLIGGMAGIFLGGYLGDRLGKGSKAAYALVPATAFILAAPLFAIGISVPSLTLAFFLFLVPNALALVWLGPVVSAVQHLVAPSMRATASAVFLFINNLIGIGFGNWFLGWMSDAYKTAYGADSLRYSFLTGLGFYVLAAILMYLASRRLERDWHR